MAERAELVGFAVAVGDDEAGAATAGDAQPDVAVERARRAEAVRFVRFDDDVQARRVRGGARRHLHRHRRRAAVDVDGAFDGDGRQVLVVAAGAEVQAVGAERHGHVPAEAAVGAARLGVAPEAVFALDADGDGAAGDGLVGGVVA